MDGCIWYIVAELLMQQNFEVEILLVEHMYILVKQLNAIEVRVIPKKGPIGY